MENGAWGKRHTWQSLRRLDESCKLARMSSRGDGQGGVYGCVLRYLAMANMDVAM